MESAKPLKIHKLGGWPKHISRRFALTESSKASTRQILVYSLIVLMLAPALALILTSQSGVVVASPDENVTENLWVNDYDFQEEAWNVYGTSPYLDDNEGGSDNYVQINKNNKVIGDFYFSDLSISGTINSVTLNIYGWNASVVTTVYLWDGSSWVTNWELEYEGDPESWVWHSIDVKSYLSTSSKINNAKIYLHHATTTSTIADAAYLEVNYTIPPPGKPTLAIGVAEPENGITTADTMPTFYWQAGAYAEDHRIEIDNEISFAQPLIENDNVVGTSWTPTTGLSVGTYYWRVWAINEEGENMSENTWEFTITTWWDTDWGNRRKIEIDPLNPENYQLKIFFDNLSGMKSDLSDLRFLENAVSGIISHWVENYTADNATIRVRRLENADNSIYVYYANPAASSVDNYDNTMTKDFGESGLALLFHMDEGTGSSVADSSGNANTGTIVNSVTWVGSDGGQWDNRDLTFSENDHLDFAGSDDYITVDSSASLDIDGSITVEAWAKFDSVATHHIIAGKRSGEAGFFLSKYQDQPYFRISTSSFGSYAALGPDMLTTGEWYHFVGTFDDDNKQVSIYVDSVLENYNINTDGLESPLTTLYIGVSESIGDNLDGQLDDLRIYNRALTAEEIKCHYERRKFVSPEPVATVGEQEPPPVLPTKPEPYLPADGDTITDETPRFEWTKGKNADNHQLLVSSDNNFTAIVENKVRGVDNYWEILSDNFLSDGKYWWKVRAFSENGENWSSTWSFTMKAISTFEYSSGVDKIWTYANDNELLEVEMSADGEFVAFGTYVSYELKFFRTSDNTLLWEKTFPNTVGAVSLTGNGQYVAAGGGTDVRLYDNEGTLQWDHEHTGDTIRKKTVKISGDGAYVTAGTEAGDILLFEGVGGDATPEWTYTAGAKIREVAISELVDGKYRVTAVSEDYNIYFFDNIDDNVPEWTYTALYKMYSVDISDNGDYIVAGGYDNRIYLRDNENNEIWTYEFTDNTYIFDYHMWFTVSISDDGQYVVGGIDQQEGYYCLLSNDDNVPIWTYGPEQEVRDVKISGDGSRIVGGGWGGRVFSWGRNDNIPIWYYGETQKRPGAIAISENGSLVAVSEAEFLHLLQDGTFAYELLTEGQLNPRRVLTTTPEFSFKLPSRKVENTIKFRIVVGENVLDVDNLMWNSPWDIENEENEVYRVYAGLTLSPYVTYQWRVRLQDNENNWSPWSVTRSFEIVELLDFPYYRTITLTEDISDNYQIKVTIDNATNMNENFKDLLFYDSTYPNVGLPYWIENREENIVWVKVHDSNPIKMCYGNDNVEDASNGDDTFPDLFDNFDGTSVDFTKWTTNYGPIVSSGEVSVTNNQRLWTKEMFETNSSLRMRANIESSSDNLYIGFNVNELTNPITPSAVFWGKSDNLYLRTGITRSAIGLPWGVGTENGSYVDYLGENTIYELKRIGADNVELWANDDNLVLSNSTYIPTANMAVFLQAHSGTGTFKVDWIFLRKCLAVEPIVTIGGEDSWGWEEIESWTGTLQNPAPPSVENIYITDMDNVATDNLAPQTQYKFWVEVADNETLADIENVTLVVYLDNENLPDNAVDHYTFRWTRENGFEQVGPIENENFGCDEGPWSSTCAKDEIHGSWFTMPEDGIPLAICARVMVQENENIQYAIYHENFGLGDNFISLVAVTEDDNFGMVGYEWTTLNIATENVRLEKGEKYYLVALGSYFDVYDNLVQFSYKEGYPSRGFSLAREYELGFPSSPNIEYTITDELFRIYCIYYPSYLYTDNCVAGDNTKTIDNFIFAIEFGEDATVTADDNWDVWVQVYDSAGNEDNRFFLNQFDIITPYEWELIETWTGDIEAPAEWQEVENWSGTVEASVAWNLVETWDGIIGVRAPAEWQLIETWDGTIEAAVQWDLIEQWSGTVTEASYSETFYIGDGNDDAFERGSGTFDTTYTAVLICSHTTPTSSDYDAGGFRFPNITIPQGSTVSSAIFSGYVYSETYDDMNCEIYGNDVDNALDFSDNPHIISIGDRPRTTASVSWVGDALGIGWENKTGLENIIEEIIGRGSWSSGNAIVLLFIANTNNIKVFRFYSHDQSLENAAKLEVTWTLPATPGKPVLISPENQYSTPDNIPTFTWTAGSDASSHRLVIDNSQNFDDGDNIYDNVNLAGDATIYTIENELPVDNYWWKIRASNAQGNNWSENTWIFEIAPPEQMDQILFSSAPGEDLVTTGTRYNSIYGGCGWYTTEGDKLQLFALRGTLSTFRVELNGSPGAGESYTFRIRKNSENTALVVTISDDATQGTDTEHTVSVAAGDKFTISSTPSASPVARRAYYSVKFSGVVENESLISATAADDPYTSTTSYNYLGTGEQLWGSTEADRSQLVSTSGKLKKLYVELPTAPSTGKSWTFTLRVNGEDTALTCQIADDATSASDLVNEVTVSAGDVVSLKSVPSGTPAASDYSSWGCVFLADIAGESLVLGGSPNDLDDTATEYGKLSAGDSWNDNEATRYVLGDGCILKNLYIKLESAPGVGKSYTLTLRLNGEDTALSCQVSGAATTASDTVNTITVSAFDLLTLKVVPDGTPATGYALRGLTQTPIPPKWNLIETWNGTIQAYSEWVLIESWNGTIEAFAEWSLIEQWSGTVQAPSAWQLIETWTGIAEAPAQWDLIEEWSGTVEAFAEWQLVETWDGTVQTPSVAVWNLLETWTGSVSAPAEWQLVESWTGTIQAPTAWNLIESWSGTVEAPTAWQLVETWSGSIQAPTEWSLIETWTGTVEAPAIWQQIESWTGTVQAPTVWQLVETWMGTIEAPTAWQLVGTWSGTVQTPSAWNLVESWTGSVQAPAEWSEVESWTGNVQSPLVTQWNLIETWTGAIQHLLAEVTTEAATGVGETSATLNASITYGSYSSVDIRFQYRVQGAGTWENTSWTYGHTQSSYSDSLSGLSDSTTYEFRGHIEFNSFEDFGDVLQFTTESPPPPPPEQWNLIETWAGTVQTHGWVLIETWFGTVRALAVYPPSDGDGVVTRRLIVLVLDNQTDKPIEGVRVGLHRFGVLVESSLTRWDGKAFLDIKVVGVHELRWSKKGYQTEVMKIELTVSSYLTLKMVPAAVAQYPPILYILAALVVGGLMTVSVRKWRSQHKKKARPTTLLIAFILPVLLLIGAWWVSVEEVAVTELEATTEPKGIGYLTITVRDNLTNKPIENAKIELYKAGTLVESKHTRWDGKAWLDIAVWGTHELRWIKEGYEDEVMLIDIVASSELTLKMVPIEGKPFPLLYIIIALAVGCVLAVSVYYGSKRRAKGAALFVPFVLPVLLVLGLWMMV